MGTSSIFTWGQGGSKGKKKIQPKKEIKGGESQRPGTPETKMRTTCKREKQARKPAQTWEALKGGCPNNNKHTTGGGGKKNARKRPPREKGPSL